MLNTERLCADCMNDNGGERICPVCGCDSAVQNPSDCLPVKFMLRDRYLIGRAKSQNGEGISYIAWDTGSDSIINIKEYFPQGFVLRNPDKTVTMAKGGEYTFNEGLMEFLEINRCIMNSQFPSLIPVTDVFEENGTVYSVSKKISCITMREFLSKNGGSLKWEQARPLFLPLIDTVKGMNDAGIIHGGISVDTVLVGRDGKLRLTGYGIKKLRLSENEITPEIYPGFAAIEQYGFEGLHTDLYTDVYGLCATLFCVLIGAVPPEAALRVDNDSMTVPAKFAEELPRHVLSALANGLQVMPYDRTENVEAFKNELVYGETSQSAVKSSVSPKAKDEAEVKEKKSGGSAKYVIISSVCTAAVCLAVAAVLVFTVFKDSVFKKNDSLPSSSSSESAPVVESIGTMDSGAAESAVLFAVPKLTGKYYAELVDNEEYEKFKFVIKDYEFSDKFTRGQISSQSVAEGTEVVRDTTVEIVISLGPKEIKIANVVGLDEEAAKLELLKQGFLYNNIEVMEKYDEDHEPGTVLEQEPKYGTSVNTEIPITIYINSYTGNDDSQSSSTGEQ